MRSSCKDCSISVHARFASINGGIVIAIVCVISAIAYASVVSEKQIASQTVLFLLLSIAGWVYLADALSECMCLTKDRSIIFFSMIGGKRIVSLTGISQLHFIHQGLNTHAGIELIRCNYSDGRSVDISLGPFWRHGEVQRFLESVEKDIGKEKIVICEK